MSAILIDLSNPTLMIMLIGAVAVLVGLIVFIIVTSGTTKRILLRVLYTYITLAVLGCVISYLVQNSEQRQETHRRTALKISEYGLLQALQKLQEMPSWNEGYAKTPYLEGWYSVELHPGDSGEVKYMTVQSRGQSGTFTRSQTCVLRMSIFENDTVWEQESLTQE